MRLENLFQYRNKFCLPSFFDANGNVRTDDDILENLWDSRPINNKRRGDDDDGDDECSDYDKDKFRDEMMDLRDAL